MSIYPDCGYILKVDFATQYGIAKSESYWVAPASRFTLYVNGALGPGYDVSFRMTAVIEDYPYSANFGRYLAVERPMYFSYTGTGGHVPWHGGHVNVASRAPLSDRYYFAEGTTREGFDEWICVLNPNEEPAQLTLNYMIEGEGLFPKQEVVPARHRATFFVADHVGRGKDVSLELVSDQPVLAERPMYFAYRNVENGMVCDGGHVITGARQADSEPRFFAFAPITFVPGMGWGNTWVCLQNPNADIAPVDIGYSTVDGVVVNRMYLPPQQRQTYYYKSLLTGYTSKEPGAFWVRAAEPSLPIMVERAVYLNFEFGGISDGTVSAGQEGHYSLTARAYVPHQYKYAEGHTGDGFTTWMVLTRLSDINPQPEYWVDCYFPGQDSITVCVGMEEQNRHPWETTVWRVNNQFPATDISFCVPAFSERIMAFTYKNTHTGMHSSVGCEIFNPGI